MLSNRLPAAVAASPGVDPAAVSTPTALHAYPADQIAPIVAAYAHAVHVVFLAAVPVPLVALVLALFLKEVPLRGTAQSTAADVGEGFGMPEGSDARQQLQLAIARLLQRKGRTHLPLVRLRSGAGFGPSDSWVVGQVYLRSRLERPPRSRRSADASTFPPRCSSPAFAGAVQRGYVSEADGEVQLTRVGQDEMDKVVRALRAWLAEELADWGADDALLSDALGDLATRFVEQAPELTPGPIGALTTGRP